MGDKVAIEGLIATAGVGVGGVSGQLRVKGFCGATGQRRLDAGDKFIVGAACQGFAAEFEEDDCPDCKPCRLDWVKLSSLSLGLVDFVKLTYHLTCQTNPPTECEGSVLRPGICLGIGYSSVTFK